MPRPSVPCAIPDCDKPRVQREWCSKHYMRWYRHGDPLATQTPGRGMDPARILAERVDISGGPDACWPFVGARHVFGYGEFRTGCRAYRAHRLAYEVAYGGIPIGLHVLHRCDNPPCCNPRHLFLGTNADNQADMRAKGRGYAPPSNRGTDWYRVHRKVAS